MGFVFFKILKYNTTRRDSRGSGEQCKQNVIKPKKSKRGIKPPKNEWQIDHIDPDSLGGSNKGENGQLLCRRCNRKKSNKNNFNFKKKNRENRKRKGYRK